MDKLGINEIREAFLSFYESKEHFRIQSFSLIPKNDKSLLIINSGMAPLKAYFAGLENPPAPRMTTCQKCIRTADIENVGITSRHGTFFEMLGSFSFGDYFKKESVTWGWEFVTEVLKMPAEKIWVSVYEKDDETYDIWKDKIGIDESHIIRMGKDDNFWEIGTGPCGPCSELYFDRGEEYGCGEPDCRPGCECDRYVEFWNHVFTQFNNEGNGIYSELDHKNIDTGMGLERVACIMQGVDSIFDVDTIHEILKIVERKTGVEYKGGEAETDISIRIITDHVRSATFMIGDQITPSNEGRGYVLRRLIRRAARHSRKLGMKKALLSEIADTAIDVSTGAYPDLDKQRVFIKKIIDEEENKFNSTLDRGMKLIEDYFEDMNLADEIILSGEKAFKLHDTYGFPIDITEEIFEEQGFGVDRKGFEAEMEKQKARGKADAEKSDEAWDDARIEELLNDKTIFTGYDASAGDAVAAAVISENKRVETISEGQIGNLIIDTTPFYAEMGGQLSDRGKMTSAGFEAEVLAVEKKNDVYVHKIKVLKGTVKTGQKISCNVDELNRNSSARNHTATHLLQQALRDVLGSHVNQAGSSVDAEGLRFDFSHFEAMSAHEIKQTESLVNEKIGLFLDVTTEEMSLADAEKSGAIGLFEDKYGDTVRVVAVGKYSRELCGGIHVKNSGQIGAFKIISENGIASGVRRIEAVTGKAVLDMLNAKEAVTLKAAQLLKTTPEQIEEKLAATMKELKSIKNKLESFEDKTLVSESADLIKNAEEINGIKLVTASFKDIDTGNLRKLSDSIKAENNKIAMVFALQNGPKVTFLVSLTKDLVDAGYHAGTMIRQIAAVAGGKGGGKADLAQAGAKDISKINDALEKAKQLL